jgi:2',3'-cyclic-nucleotide 2'-phosphodiesterase (5'-nucleotidase family)
LLLVDAGNFFATGNRLTRLVSVVAWKEMERLGYDAVTLGQAELTNWKLVQLLLAEDSLHVVTTNLERRVADGWRPVGVPSRVINRDGVRVGILGITMDSEMREWMHRVVGDSLRLLPPARAARDAIHDLAERSDLILVLLAGNDDDLKSFAAAVPEADVIVGGRCAGTSCTPEPGPGRIGRAVVNTAGVGGSSVGLTKLVIAPRRGILECSTTMTVLRRQMPKDSVIARDALRIMKEVEQLQGAYAKRVSRGHRETN